MEHAPRTLIIHAGGPKTGSSALQNYLELNADSLQTCGADYEHRLGITRDDQRTSGNGQFFFDSLMTNSVQHGLPVVIENRFDEPNISAVLESFFGTNNCAICSSELFVLLKPEHWESLYLCAEKLNLKIHVIFFVRDVAPYFIAIYDQFIKSYGVSTTLMDWAKDMRFSHSEFLKKMLVFKDRLNFKLTVLHYDSNKDQIIPRFIETFLIPTQLPPPKKNFIVNRSLSRQERELLLRINKQFGSRFSNAIADKMLYSYPQKEVDRRYDQKFLDHLQERFAADLIWINENFFAGQSVVKIIDEDFLSTSQATPVTAEGTQVHDLVLDWTFEKISSLEQHTASLEQHVASLKQGNRVDALLRPLKNFLRPAKNFLKRRR